MHHKVLGALTCVVVICRLAAAKLGRRVRSLLHLDGNRDLRDPIVFYASPDAITMNPPLRAALFIVNFPKIVSTYLIVTFGR